MSSAQYAICILPGDGIGPEVIGCAQEVLEALHSRVNGPRFTFDLRPAGNDAFIETGDSLPQATVEAAKSADGVMLGAMDVAQLPPTATQPLRAMRRHLDVGASVRPARSYSGVPIPAGEIDVIVVREVTEGIFSGIEYPVGNDGACSVRVITREASTRTARIAFEQASRRRGKVTAVHKLGALKLTDSLFLESVADVAASFPDITYETRNVDACALELVRGPDEFDVILATNAFGDILSDVAAGLAGGLGIAPSGCVGERWAYFEPVHGTAPDIAGKGIANPIASILSAALMLRHIGEPEAGARIENAVSKTLASEKFRTGDLGGNATSAQVTEGVIGFLGDD